MPTTSSGNTALETAVHPYANIFVRNTYICHFHDMYLNRLPLSLQHSLLKNNDKKCNIERQSNARQLV
jgi:hypothetical protein